MSTAGAVALCLVFCAVALVWVASLAFVCGLVAYASVYNHFLAKQEQIAAVRVQKALQEQARKALDKQQILEKLKERYGEIPEAHSETASEELERILSAGPRR